VIKSLEGWLAGGGGDEGEGGAEEIASLRCRGLGAAARGKSLLEPGWRSTAKWRKAGSQGHKEETLPPRLLDTEWRRIDILPQQIEQSCWGNRWSRGVWIGVVVSFRYLWWFMWFVGGFGNEFYNEAFGLAPGLWKVV